MTRVLIIEDEEYYRKFLLRILEKLYYCECATDGNQAKQMLRNNGYDVAIYDLRLPGTGGKELISYTRQNIDPDIINIVITGYEQDWPPVEATAEDVFFYFKKGNFGPDELLKVVDSAARFRALKLKENSYIKNLMAQEKIASTGKLAMGIAHEINNPLQCIIAVIDSFRDKFRSNNQLSPLSGDLELLEKGAERIRCVVKNLLDLYRIDHEREGVDLLGNVVRRVVSFIHPIAKEQGARIKVHPGVWEEKVYMPEHRFFYIMLNTCMALLDNNHQLVEVKSDLKINSVIMYIRTLKRKHAPGHKKSGFYASLKDTLNIDLVRKMLEQCSGKLAFQEKQKEQVITMVFSLQRKNRESDVSICRL
ncbi:MAG: response regulator [Spirochaetota bacterium]